MNAASHYSGHIAVIGRPNVGKSTLVNALVGAKVSIVSPRPQTTRHRLLGIANVQSKDGGRHGQLLLVDTPGLHSAQGKSTSSAMHRWMSKSARGALQGVEAALLVVEAGRWQHEDLLALQLLQAARQPIVLVVNQIDRLPDKTVLLPYLQQISEGQEFAGVHPISALKREGLQPLIETLLSLLPQRAALYDNDEITDSSQRFMAAELIREQLMRQLGAELPYATTVEIERFVADQSANTGVLLRIGAVIWVEREGQKAIVIGKGGARLREIGSKARIQMERLFGQKIFLETWVRVRQGWSDDETALRAFGYHD